MATTITVPAGEGGLTAPAQPTQPVVPDGQTQQPAADPNARLYAGKFTSTDELERSYLELQSKMGAQGAQAAPAAPAAQTIPAAAQPTQPTIPQPATPAAPSQEAVQASGVDIKTYEQEYAQNGALSVDSYNKLAQAGWNKDIVDNYIAGQVARAEAMTTQVMEIGGGQDQYGKMIAWAGSNMTPAEQAIFNDAVTSNDINRARFAVEGLKARYEATNGKPPQNPLVGGAPSASGGYASHAEMVQEMSDPRYQSDPLFRKEVERKAGLFVQAMQAK